MATLRAPEHGAPVHWRGKIYEIRHDGSVQVPDEAVAALLAHGFTPWPGGDLPPPRRREG